MKFEARWERILKQLKLLRLSVKCWYRCGERFWQFGNSFDIVTEICRSVVVCQLLKGQQILVCSNRRRRILTAKLRLTGIAVLFLFSRRCTGGASIDFLVNSCHQVLAVFWAKVSRRLVVKDACFRMRISLGVVLFRTLVFAMSVPGRLWSGSGVAQI